MAFEITVSYEELRGKGNAEVTLSEKGKFLKEYNVPITYGEFVKEIGVNKKEVQFSGPKAGKVLRNFLSYLPKGDSLENFFEMRII